MADELGEHRPPTLDLQGMLDLLAETVVMALGFEAVAVNLVESPERVVVVSVAGPEEVRQSLLDTSTSLADWEVVLAAGSSWGRLVFLDHAQVSHDDISDAVSWVPHTSIVEDPEAWHPEDSLFAPLHASDGSLLGVLSVDLPRGGRRPDADTCKSLEAFGVSAALAIEHATLRARAEHSEELFREVFSASPLGMALLDEAGVALVANEALGRILQRAPAEITGRRLGDFNHPADVRRESDQTSGLADPSRGERFLRADGSSVWVEVTHRHLQSGGQVVAQVRDVTEQREAVNRLQHLATHDPATGVGNRSLLLERLRGAITGQASTRSGIALLFIDLDGFKRVNDNFSHSVGDQVLRIVAQRLSTAVRPDDCVVRWGGDEFIVLIDPLPWKQTALDLAERIGEALATPFEVDWAAISITSSIGVAFADPDAGLDVQELLRNADTAMFRAKREGKSSLSIYQGDIEESSARSHHVASLLLGAVEKERVVVHYQPVFGLDDGSVRAVEALIRLPDDNGELLYPESFVSSAQDAGQLPTLECVALRAACRQTAEWTDQGFPLRLSVNLAAGRLDDLAAVTVMVQKALDDSGLAAQQLVLEINEPTLHEVRESTLLRLQTLVDAGVGFSVDGLRSGVGWLAYLRTLPIHEIRIEGAVVEQAPTDEDAAAIVRAHVRLAEELGLRCVAKGVETREQDALLRTAGITLGQGFLYEQPVRAEILTDYLRSWSVSTPGSSDGPTEAGQPQRTDE